MHLHPTHLALVALGNPTSPSLPPKPFPVDPTDHHEQRPERSAPVFHLPKCDA